MWVLYLILLILVVGYFALLIGAMVKYITYPMITEVYLNEFGNTRTRRVPDTKYHYKESELWEPSSHWIAPLKQAEEDRKPKGQNT